jgi:hemerythrin-like domain-containing protein
MKIANPIAVFMQEHDVALVELQRLKKSADQLSRDGYSEKAFQQLLNAMAYIETEISIHNRKEDEILFPVLEQYVEGPTALMRKDHLHLAKLYRVLRKRVKQFQQNHTDIVALQEIQETATAFVQLMVNHIQKENQILFPLVQRFLSKKELQRVAQQML